MTRLITAAGAAAAIAAGGIDASIEPKAAAPPPTPLFVRRLAVTPDDVALFPGAALRFHLVGSGSGSSVRWSLIGSGSISSDGSYTAPAATGTAHVIASTGGAASAVTLRIVPPPSQTAGLAVVSCYDDGTIDVRSANNYSRVGLSSTASAAAGVAAAPGLHVALVASGDRLDAFDLHTGLFNASARVAGTRFSEVALLAGGFAAVTDNNAAFGKAGVRIFRLANGRPPVLAGSAAAGETPEGIAASRDRTTFYVTNVNSNTVMRFSIDASGKARLTGSAATGHRPFGVAVDDARKLLFVADNDTPTVSGNESKPGLEAFSLPAMRRVAVFSMGSPNALPLGVAVDAPANRLFVTNEGDGDVVAYSIAPLRKIGTAAVGRTPWLPAIDAARGRILVPSASGDSLAVLDVLTLRAVATNIKTCGYPTSVAIF
jgi:DNA-binding beta-propeller fold protein YncE